MNSEKRKYPRVPVLLPVTYCSENLTLEAHVSNLSQEGVFITCPTVDQVGTRATLRLTLPGTDRPVSLSGQVVWSHGVPPFTGMGLLLTDLSRDLRLALANFLIARIYSA